ncbi:PREDICTED: ankyrin repeat-containing protein NPR4-like [Camelina sativa]|uniref:Ankyrin repeat-containing protein NPR4-like n=1 Tax=Camelina sativa TaxID=90675 RepID=A0ABM1RPS6_CAMSA|nr:PREDICTED: ankyrin repeat-containing protein NPR4-like [Camelina sativa]
MMMEKNPLMEAARKGDVEYLLRSTESDPTLLEVIVVNGEETPLHVASMYGHFGFVREVLKLRESLGKELNKDGFTPLHIAASMGHVEVVRELLEKLSGEICLIKGKDRKIPLHYAAMRGRVPVLDELVSANPESLEEITARGETVLHLAVRYYQFDGFVVLLERLKEFDKLCVLNKQDNGGNTVLHLAVQKRQYEVIDLLLGSNNTIPRDFIEVNSLNSNGFTPLDVLLHFGSEPEDVEIHQILTKSGAVRSRDLDTRQSTTTTENETTPSEESLMTHKQWLDYFKYKKDRVSPHEVRNVLLVIAILIATATYQAVLSPPGGVWQEDYCIDGFCKVTDLKENKTKPVYYAGTTIMGSKSWVNYGIFIFLNSVGFFTSIELISLLTKGLPFYLELQVSLNAVALTYGFAMAALSPNFGLGLFFMVLSVVLPIAVARIPSLIRKHAKKIRIYPLRNGTTTTS